MVSLAVPMPQLQMFFLVFLRTGAFLMSLPMLNAPSVPVLFRLALTLAASLLIFPLLSLGSPAAASDLFTLAVAAGGEVLIGVLAGFAGPVQTALLMAKNLRVQGLTVGSRQQQLDMIAGIEANGIRPVISDHFPLERLADAFRHQAANAHFGKIVVDI